MTEQIAWITPDWPAPPQVKAISSCRSGGVSQSPYQSLNLGNHVGDDPQAVATNRTRLRQQLNLPAEPYWLEQQHGCSVCNLDQIAEQTNPPVADAAMTSQPGKVCAVLTADCLPILLCDRSGYQVAVVHAGWRGFIAGVIETTVAQFHCPSSDLIVWLGPAIGPQQFEVGDEVYQQFVDWHQQAAIAFTPTRPGHWLADLYQLARQRLQQANVVQISGGDHCTFSEPERFFSYRRDGITGRTATLIWIDEQGVS